MNFKEIAKKVLDNGNDVIGLRSLCDDESNVIGAECRESYEWDFEKDCSTFSTTGETAGGTCVTFINTDYVFFNDYDGFDIEELANNIEKAYNVNKAYVGRKVIVVGDSYNTDGAFDKDEARIINAKVLLEIE